MDKTDNQERARLEPLSFYPTALKCCLGIVFLHGVQMDGWASGQNGRAAGKRLFGLHLRNHRSIVS